MFTYLPKKKKLINTNIDKNNKNKKKSATETVKK